MAKLGVSSAFALLICLSLTGTHAAVCSQESLLACQETHFPKLTYKPGDDVAFPVLTAEEYDEICAVFKGAFTECISAFEIEDNCTSGDSIQQAIQFARDRACAEGGKERYLAGLPCFSNDDVQKEGSVCQDTGRVEIAKLVAQSQADPPPNEETAQDLKEQFCKVVKEWQFDCIYKLLANECGEEVALARYTYDRVGWSATMNEQGCDPLDEDPTTYLCDAETILACKEKYFGKLLYKKGDDVAFPVLTEAEYDEICSSGDAYTECVSTFDDSCVHLEGVRIPDAFRAGCAPEVIKQYFDKVSCFNQSKVQEEGVKCQDTGRDEMAKILSQLQANPPPNEAKTKDLKEQFCKVVKEFQFDCIYKLLTEECDDETALIQYLYDRSGWSATMAKQGCDPLDEDPTSATGTLGCTLLVHLAAILLAWSCVA